MKDSPKTLESLALHIGDCRRCPLGETRTRLVFGAGNPDADIMLIGEAPGRMEDLKGEPFVGAAGRLLDELLSSIGLTKDDVYIANVLKCRPPDNRDPLISEVEACSDYLWDQVRIIRPRVLVTLGNHATRFVIKTDKGITALRGTPVTLDHITVLPVFHPAAAIYDVSKRSVLFDDFKLIASLANILGQTESTLLTTSPEVTLGVGRILAGWLEPDDVILLCGDLGAGKTMLTKGIAEGLGVTGTVTSPTFSLVREHVGRLIMHHMDLYRLESSKQLEDIGYYDALEAGGISIIEWGDRFPDALPDERLLIGIEIIDDDRRALKIKASGKRYEKLMAEWLGECESLHGLTLHS